MLVALDDGTPVLIRPIRSEDKALLSEGIAHLSDRTVHRRFLTTKRHFTSAELRYLTEVDGHDHVALVAEDPTRARCPLAIGRFVRLAEDSRSAEVAIVVADAYQGRGLGSLLGRELAAEAARQGVRRFTATVLSENRPAAALMAKLTGHLESHHSGARTSELSAPLAA